MDGRAALMTSDAFVLVRQHFTIPVTIQVTFDPMSVSADSAGGHASFRAQGAGGIDLHGAVRGHDVGERRYAE